MSSHSDNSSTEMSDESDFDPSDIDIPLEFENATPLLHILNLI